MVPILCATWVLVSYIWASRQKPQTSSNARSCVKTQLDATALPTSTTTDRASTSAVFAPKPRAVITLYRTDGVNRQTPCRWDSLDQGSVSRMLGGTGDQLSLQNSCLSDFANTLVSWLCSFSQVISNHRLDRKTPNVGRGWSQCFMRRQCRRDKPRQLADRNLECSAMQEIVSGHSWLSEHHLLPK